MTDKILKQYEADSGNIYTHWQSGRFTVHHEFAENKNWLELLSQRSSKYTAESFKNFCKVNERLLDAK